MCVKRETGRSSPGASPDNKEVTVRIVELVHDEDHPGYTNVDKWVLMNPGFSTRRIVVYDNFDPPAADSFDLLIIHGGAQHLWDKDSDPWLYRELAFVSDVLKRGKPVIGFCLGSQIIAEALGGRVYEMEDKEIGWFGISLKNNTEDELLLKGISDGFETFLWHSDHYALPDYCVSLGLTPAAGHQIFYSIECPAVAYQFHPEYSIDIIRFYFETCYDEYWTEGTYVARKEGFLEDLAARSETYVLFEMLMNNALVHFEEKFEIQILNEVGL